MHEIGIGLLVIIAVLLILAIIAIGIRLYKHELTWKEVLMELFLEALNPFNWF